MSSRAVAVTLAACLMSPLPACSFIVTSAPSAPPADPDCMQSRFPIAVDVLASVVSLFTAGIASIGDHNDGAVAIGSVMAIGLAASSVYGLVRTSQCRSAYANHYVMPAYAPPPGYGPPPGTPPPASPPAPYPAPE